MLLNLDLVIIRATHRHHDPTLATIYLVFCKRKMYENILLNIYLVINRATQKGSCISNANTMYCLIKKEYINFAKLGLSIHCEHAAHVARRAPRIPLAIITIQYIYVPKLLLK